MNINSDEESDDVSVPTVEKNDSEETRMPWAAFSGLYTYLKEKDEKDFLARCKLCLPKVTSLSCSVTSSSNMKGHLKRIHSYSDEQIKSLTLESSNSSAEAKRRKTGGDGDPKGKRPNELFKKKITQKDVDDAVIQLVISGTLAHRVVDLPQFKRAVLLGLPEILTVPCHQTLRKRLNEYHELMETNIKKELRSVNYVASCADVWTKHHRAFLGINITWIDKDTMERKAAAIALKRLTKRHTFQVLGSAMCEEYGRYGLSAEGKLVKCTTDSASNFRKAFDVYTHTPSLANERDKDTESSFPIPNDDETSGDDYNNTGEASEDDGEEDDNHYNPIAITDLGENVEGIVLPSHQRCSAHILDLLAKTDAVSALSVSPNYKKVHDSTNEKVKIWHRRQSRSDMAAQVIQKHLGVLLIVPVKTRWNSEFDSKQQIVKLEKTYGKKIDKALEHADLPMLTPAEWRYMREYVYVMGPVALALDLIKRDKNMYAGYLIPTILSLERQLIARRLGEDGKPLKYCGALVDAILEAIPKPGRFGKYLKDRDLSLATCLLPCFKLHWTNDPQRTTELKAALLTELSTVNVPIDVPDSEIRVSSVSTTQTQEAEGEAVNSQEGTAEDNFFGFNSYRRQTSNSSTDALETADKELERYLNEPFTDQTTVASCYALKPDGKREYPRLWRLFLKYNTPLPSSGGIERLFSGAGHSFNELKSRLGDKSLEIELQLKLNAGFWQQ